MKIYLTNTFKSLLNFDQFCIELGYYRLGTLEGLENTSIRELNVQDIEKDYGRAPTSGFYLYDGVILPEEGRMMISFKIPENNISFPEDYKVIYGIYKNLQTGNAGLAFIIECYQELTDEINLINFPLPEFKCSISLKASDEDIPFLEGSGVGKNFNMYKYLISHPTKSVDRNFLSKNSFDSYYSDKRSSDDFDHDNTVFINKFGIKIY